MKLSARRARILLVLGTIILPGVVLIAATVRLGLQERELASRRLEERRALLAAGIGQELVVRLDRLRARMAETAQEDSAVLVVAQYRGGRLSLPWDERRPVVPNPDFIRLLAAGEAAEFTRRAAAEAAVLYAKAAAAAPDSTTAGEALLREARALTRAGQAADAADRYRRAATFSAAIRDEDGVPLALYAIEGLARDSAGHEAARRSLLAVAQRAPMLGLTTLYMIQDLAAQVNVDPGSELGVRIAEVERLRALESALPALLALSRGEAAGDDGAWMPFGPDPWLVTVRQQDGGPTAQVLVTRPAVLLRAMAADTGTLARVSGAARLTAAAEPTAEMLGPALPGMRIVFADSAMLAGGGPPIGGRMFLVVLTGLLGLTLIVGWLLWRDVRREVAAAELRSQFVSGVSHELKTPLTSIRMFAETLLLGRPRAEDARREYLETIVHESERLTRLINNVLDFSRIERGEQRYTFAPTDLGDVVRDSVRAMSYPLAQGGFELAVAAPEQVPLIPADRDALTQAVLNLLSNAMKFSGASRRIELELAASNGDMSIAVRDRGRGVSAFDRGRIFERFYRSPEVEAASIPGTGLGLALVAHVVSAHGGRVDVESTPGVGSTFTLRLPMEPAA